MSVHHILSISLGSSRRDKVAHMSLLGEDFVLERRGTDGDLERFGRFMRQNDGKVDVLCVGGANLGLHWNGRYYPFRDVLRVTRDVKQTPIVDGSGVKDTLERETIGWLQREGVVDFNAARVFLVCGIDRFGMAEALREYRGRLILGDLMFNLGVPIPIRSHRTLDVLAPLLLPILRRTPFRWLYPTGTAQDKTQPKYVRYYRWAEVIAGDYLLIRKHMPADLAGKTIVTNTTTDEDEADLRERGVARLITTTPVVEGRSFGTNLMEGVVVTLLGRPPEEIAPQEYLEIAARMGWSPTVRNLNPEASSPA